MRAVTSTGTSVPVGTSTFAAGFEIVTSTIPIGGGGGGPPTPPVPVVPTAPVPDGGGGGLPLFPPFVHPSVTSAHARAQMDVANRTALTARSRLPGRSHCH